MYYLKLGEKLLPLPTSELYITYFKDVINDNYINLDNVEQKEKYRYLNNLLKYVCNTLTIINEDSMDEELANECKKMHSIDNMQAYLYDNGRTEAAIKKIEEFIGELLITYSKLKTTNHRTI